MAETRQKNYRFSIYTLELIDRLGESYGGLSRSDVIRIAIQELAERKLFPRKPPSDAPKR